MCILAKTEPAPNAGISHAERRARIHTLQAELGSIDIIRDGVRNAVRTLHELQSVLDADPVRNSRLYDLNIAACCEYSKAAAILTTEYNALDTELTALCHGEDVEPMAPEEAVAASVSPMAELMADLVHSASVKAGTWGAR